MNPKFISSVSPKGILRHELICDLAGKLRADTPSHVNSRQFISLRLGRGFKFASFTRQISTFSI